MPHKYPPDIQTANERANELTLRGIALLEQSDATGWREAIRLFDEAIQVRRALPRHQYSWIQYGFIAGWMNRGDALTKLGGAKNLEEAVGNYDEALRQLRELRMNESPWFKLRLAIAWLNRGVTLQTMGTPDALVRAAESFEEATGVAQNLVSSGFKEATETLACAWMNRANVKLRQEPPLLVWAQELVKKSESLLREEEKKSVAAGRLALKARHIHCQILAELIGVEEERRDALMSEASDIVDEGMEIARYWEAQGARQFSGWANDLFRFGCRVYQMYQPHFLTEFLLENLDPAKSAGAFAGNHEMHANAMDSVWHSLAAMQREGFKNISSARFEGILDSLRELRVTEERLGELRKRNR